MRRKGHCKARIKLLVTNAFIEQTNEHTHPPSQTNCEVVKAKASIKPRAETAVDPSRQILADELSDNLTNCCCQFAING